MPRETIADAWTHAEVERLAERHFPARGRTLENLVRRMARRHETSWRSDPAGRFRPTSAMYALALRWQLDKLGPTCAFCKGKVEVPARPPPSGPARLTLSLALRVPANRGGLNVPQNLALCHNGCGPAQ